MYNNSNKFCNSTSYIFTTVLIVLMVLVSELSGEREIIFPEITAMAIGAWIAPVMPWKVTKPRLFGGIAFNAIAGILVVKYVHVPLMVQIIIGYVISALYICLFRISFFPMISAAVLPIMMGTTTFVYPISAIIMAGIIVLVQQFMEKKLGRKKIAYVPTDSFSAKDVLLWGKRTAVVAVLALICTKIGYLYVIAPPLLVAFTELSNSECKARKSPLKIYMIVCSGAVVGSYSRYFLSVKLGVPLAVSMLITLVYLLFIIHKTGLYFPPAGPMATLPMLINENLVFSLPVQVIIGFTLLMGIAVLFFRTEKEKLIN